MPLAYKDYRHPDATMTRMAAAYLFANGEYRGLANTRSDYNKVGPLSVIKVAAGDYRAWPEMVSLAPISGGPRTYNGGGTQSGDLDADTILGYWTSSDGTTWTGQDNPGTFGTPDRILTPNSPTNPAGGNTDWMRGESSIGSLVYDAAAGLYKCWGHGGNNTGPRAIFYATSTDGQSWTFQNNGQAVLSKGASGTWDDKWVADSKVVRINAASYVMIYRGQPVTGNPRPGLAVSADGLNWTKVGTSYVIPSGGGGSWDAGAIYPGGIIYDATFDVILLWYGGDATGDNGGQGLGYAWSPDHGVTWTKSPHNPVHGVSASGLDSAMVGDTIEAYRDVNLYRVHYGAEKNVPPYFRGRIEATVATTAINCALWNSMGDGVAQLSDLIPNLVYGDREHVLQVTLQTGSSAPVSGGYCECWIVPSVDGVVKPAAGGMFVRALPMPTTANTGRTFEVDLTAVCAWPPPYYAVRIVNRCGNALDSVGNSLILDSRGL
jgi:hypothetical protein